MPRRRVSTTVDAARLARARALTGDRDSELFDKALAALIDDLEGLRELAALARHPYDDDPDLDLPEAEEGGDLPYDGRVPPDVIRLARERRRRRA
jgi:hypothetical protein